jgi:hypothetical protein
MVSGDPSSQLNKHGLDIRAAFDVASTAFLSAVVGSAACADLPFTAMSFE